MHPLPPFPKKLIQKIIHFKLINYNLGLAKYIGGFKGYAKIVV
jgi:hypothetical protein